jgi:DNA-binding FadR family transcriptional regulator
LSDKQPIDVNPLRRVTLAESLLTELRAQILSGRLESGRFLPPELQLTEAFGVGRTTVREALRGLLAAGLVERQGNRLVVSDPRSLEQDQLDYAALATRVSVRDLYQTRKLIEVRTAELAAEHWPGSGLLELRRLMERTEAPHDQAFHGADSDFHDAVARLCGNPVLLAVYDNSRDFFFRLPTYWRLFGHSAKHAAEDGPGEHRAIYEAVAARDPEAAGDAMFDHLDRIELDMLARLETETETETAGVNV